MLMNIELPERRGRGVQHRGAGGRERVSFGNLLRRDGNKREMNRELPEFVSILNVYVETSRVG
jgi:hypothetical protein